MTGQHAIRKRLPDTRESITHKVTIEGADLYVIVGLYPDTNMPGELFLKMGKVGSTMRGLLDILGIQTSLLLQNGVELEDLCRKMVGVSYEPKGWTSNPEIRTCSSVSDYVFKWMERRFLNVETPTSQGSDRVVEGEAGAEEASRASKVRKGTKSRGRRKPD